MQEHEYDISCMYSRAPQHRILLLHHDTCHVAFGMFSLRHIVS